MRPHIKRDLIVALSALIAFGVYVAIGFALGKVNPGHVADMIATRWVMFGGAVFFVTMIVYHGVTQAPFVSSKGTADEKVDNPSYLSGKTVAIVASLVVIVIIALVANAVMSDD